MSLTLAERNKNPLNIILTKPPTPWIGCDELQRYGTQQSNRFVRFVGNVSLGLSPEACGWRAAAVTILHWYHAGRNTIRKLISTWAPPSDGNNTEAYIKTVAHYSGYSADQKLDFTIPPVLRRVMWAMHIVEAGKEWGHDADLDAGIRAALHLIPKETQKWNTPTSSSRSPQALPQPTSPSNTTSRESSWLSRGLSVIRSWLSSIKPRTP